MKEAIAFILLVLVGLIAHLFLPWWTIAVVGFLVGLGFLEQSSKAFLIGFLAVFILWGSKALLSSFQNDFILLSRMSELLPFKYSFVTILITAFMGGIIGAFSTASGYFLQTIGKKRRSHSRF